MLEMNRKRNIMHTSDYTSNITIIIKKLNLISMTGFKRSFADKMYDHKPVILDIYTNILSVDSKIAES